jgi:hypothetical protein
LYTQRYQNSSPNRYSPNRSTTLTKLENTAPALHVLASLIYAASMYFAYSEYLYPQWGYYGFKFHEPDFADVAFAVALIVPVSMFFPRFIVSPSTVVLSILHCIFFVPAIVITLCLSASSIDQYWWLLISLSGGFLIALSLVRFKAPQFDMAAGTVSKTATLVLVLAWLSLAGILVFVHGGNMKFASLEEVYEQRAASGGVMGSFLSYATSLLGTFFSPTILSIGLTQKRYSYIALGAAGCILIYTINASRTLFLLPLAILLFYFAIRKGKSLLSCAAIVPLFFALAVYLIVENRSATDAGGNLAIYFVFRNLSLPGLTLSQYYDVFSANGFTYWSHVKGISLVVPPPEAFATDRLWPNLGYIIGDRVYGVPKLNANANLFSGDGAAAAGSLGVLVISTIFGTWLRLLDGLSAKWNRNLVLLTAVPIAVQLTNGHFFTMLISFGGALLMLLLYFGTPVSPKRN